MKAKQESKAYHDEMDRKAAQELADQLSKLKIQVHALSLIHILSSCR